MFKINVHEGMPGRQSRIDLRSIGERRQLLDRRQAKSPAIAKRQVDTIVSVWDVADQPTSRLLPAFYRQWLNGADKASALRSAQLSLIRSLRKGELTVTSPAGTFVLPEDPAFWAAFVLLGEPD